MKKKVGLCFSGNQTVSVFILTTRVCAIYMSIDQKPAENTVVLVMTELKKDLLTIKCPYYKPSDKMGKENPICKYIMKDLDGKWCLCSHKKMFLCSEWLLKNKGIDLWEEKNRQKGSFK